MQAASPCLELVGGAFRNVRHALKPASLSATAKLSDGIWILFTADHFMSQIISRFENDRAASVHTCAFCTPIFIYYILAFSFLSFNSFIKGCM